MQDLNKTQNEKVYNRSNSLNSNTSHNSNGSTCGNNGGQKEMQQIKNNKGKKTKSLYIPSQHTIREYRKWA